MNFDQYEDPTPEQVELARAARMLVAALYDENGKAKDLTDREGREALRQAINRLPREIPAKIDKGDRELLNRVLKELMETRKDNEQTRKTVKNWFWWVMATMFVAVSLATLCAVSLFK